MIKVKRITFTFFVIQFILLLSSIQAYAQIINTNNMSLNVNRKDQPNIPLFYANTRRSSGQINKSFNFNHYYNSNFVLDSIVGSYDEGNYFRHSFSFNSNGDILTRMYEKGPEDQLTKNWFVSYNYNEHSLVSAKVSDRWNDSIWLPSSKDLYFYNADLELTSEIYQIFNEESIDFINFEKIEHNYESTGNINTSTLSTWDSGNSEWIEDINETYTYDDNNNLIQFLSESYNSTSLEILYEYDEMGNIFADSSTHVFWNGFNWEFLESYKSTYEYDDQNNLIREINEMWSSDIVLVGPAFNRRRTYSYDDKNNVIEDLIELWNWENNEGNWVNSSKVTYTFDSSSNLVTALGERWENNQWYIGKGNIALTGSENFNINIYADFLSAFYSPLIDITNAKHLNPKLSSKYSLSKNYPNPFNPTTVIEYTISNVVSGLPAGEASFSQINVSLKVYDILGNEVADLVNKSKPAGKYKVSFDASSFSSGIYFYRLQSGNFSETKKLTLLK